MGSSKNWNMNARSSHILIRWKFHMKLSLSLLHFLDQSSKEVCISAKQSLQILDWWSPVELEVQGYIRNLVVQKEVEVLILTQIVKGSWASIEVRKKISSLLPEVKTIASPMKFTISEVQLTSLSARSAPPPVEECIHHVLTTDRSCSMIKLEEGFGDTWRMVHRSVSACGELVQEHVVQVAWKYLFPLQKLVKYSTPKQRIQSLLAPARSSPNKNDSRSSFLTHAEEVLKLRWSDCAATESEKEVALSLKWGSSSLHSS